MKPYKANRTPPVIEDRSSLLRQVVDGLVCLAIAVMLFRTFEVEGYIISTGSMAPSLLGYHKRVVCPACGHQFAHGVSPDSAAESPPSDSETIGAMADIGAPPPGRVHATCPNCSETGIDISRVPRNEGDQLLVHKQAFLFTEPRRWEVVVFRNPMQPTQAYVKRVVGLPGERVQVRRGDVFINGRICRKNLEQQHALRIPVYDFAHRPADDRDWRPRWLVSGSATIEGNAIQFGMPITESAESGPPLSAPSDAAAPEIGSAEYRHWIRRGGAHVTSVPLKQWPGHIPPPDSVFTPVSYDADRGLLICHGAMADAVRDALLKGCRSRQFRDAVDRLHEQSHSPPVFDGYGYNRHDHQTPHAEVWDLQWEGRVERLAGQGTFSVAMGDGADVYACRIDFSARSAELVRMSDGLVLQRVPLQEKWISEPFELSLSLFDRQVVIAVQGEPLFAPHLLEELDDCTVPPRRPIRLAAEGLAARVDRIRIYRDVYYTRGTGRHGVDREYALKSDEYFVLGDNSPVSLDSREWSMPAVNRKMLLGKPFIVHLPSRPGLLRLGGYEGHIRIPDVSRIRYIR